MGQRYDVVIVGAGSAGCVLAGRLSDDPRREALLLEAGPAATTPAIDGASFFAALDEPGRTYTDVMVERTRGAALTSYRLGRGVGGSSAVNAMVASLGLREDYDHWERDLGCAGWSWRDVCGTLGVLSLIPRPAPTKEWGAVDQALIEAARFHRHPACPDPLLPGAFGAGPAMLTRADGHRVSATDPYLATAGGRANLTIRSDTEVARVLLDGRRAVGVELVDGEVIEAAEVVVAAGAIHSPLLLLRSRVDREGIGVGLKDHPSATLTLRLREPADTSRLAAAALLRWSSSTGLGDLQVLPLNHVGNPDYGALIVGLMAVHSSGSVGLVDGRPRVQFNMLDDEHDLERLRDGARHAFALATTEAMQWIAEGVFVDDVGTPLEAFEDGDQFDAWLIANVGDYMHASSTCRMGTVDDPASVVDTACRVHGYANLRVCDASVFPDIPTGNPHLPTMMVAERIAKAMITSAS